MNGESFPRQAHDWPVLFHPSNLPLVWSGCLAGAWLGGFWPGDEHWDRLAILLVGASALFAAGNFPHGGAGPRARWSGVGCLAVGLGMTACLGWLPFALGAALVGWIILCSWRREHPAAGAAFVVGNRLLLYPLASVASLRPEGMAATGEGALLAAYFLGWYFVAGREHRPPWWPWLLLFLPVTVNAALSAHFGPGRLIVVALPVFWLGRIAFGRVAPLGLGRAPALLAGSILIDLSAVVACAATLPWPGWFAILFVLALVSARFARAA